MLQASALFEVRQAPAEDIRAALRSLLRERQFYCARLRNDSTSHRSRLTPGRHPRRFHLDGKARTGFTFGFARGASEPCNCSSRSTSDPSPKVATRIRRPAPLDDTDLRHAQHAGEGAGSTRCAARAGWKARRNSRDLHGPTTLSGVDVERITASECAARRCLTAENATPFRSLIALRSGDCPFTQATRTTQPSGCSRKIHLSRSGISATPSGFHILADLRKRSEIPFRSLNRQTLVLPSALPDTATARPAIRRANRRPGYGCPTDRGSRTGTAGSV